jgi:hypothetical protein
MAQAERDNANMISEEHDRKSRPSRDIIKGRDKPLFTSRRLSERKSFGRTTEDEDDSSSSTSRPGSGGGNWLSGRNGRGIRLGEAFQRIDDNGDLKPRTGPITLKRSGREGSVSESRIPRSKTFPPGAGLSPSPPRSLKEAYAAAQRKERAASAPVESESDSAGPREGSPSPAARDSRRFSMEGSGSDLSRISLVEDPTEDDFDTKMKQFSRDQERLRGAITNQKGLFSKPDIGPRIAETTRTLARKTSASSLESEPPVRLPRTWGSRAKKPGDWMKRILSPDTSQEIKDLALSDQQVAAADVPLPSIETSSSVQEPTPPSSRPASAQPKNMSPEKSKVWDADIDFTAQSLQISTSPQLRVRSTKLDEVREREIQSLTARAVASNRLEEIRERNSEDRSTLSDSVRMNANGLDTKTIKGQEDNEKEEFHEMTIMEEEGEHIPNTPITIFSAASYRGGSNHSSRERKSNHDRDGSTGKSDHKREDFREILRRLSRATSASPAPSRSEDKIEGPSSTTQEDNEIQSRNTVGKAVEDPLKSNSLDVDVDMKRRSTASTPPKSDVDPEERITAEAKLFELQDNKSERNSIRASSRSPSPSDDGKFDETPKPKADPLSLPTPKVTGAYIDTPAPTVRKPRKSHSISDSYELVNADGGTSSSENKRNQKGSSGSSDSLERDQSKPKSRGTSSRREHSKPQSQATKQSQPRRLRNSVNPTTVAEDLRRIQLEAQIEDSTLDDFNALLKADNTATENFLNNNTTILEPVLDLEYDEMGNRLSQNERERRLERLTLDRMNQHLKNTSSSIRDARQGIERLEHQVSSSSSRSQKRDDTLYVKIPVPRLWISASPTHGRNQGLFKTNWKFTWLGFILAIFFSWYIAESAMCEVYCHPLYSSHNTWHPSDPFFPWAIPTKLDQWTGGVVSTTAYNVWQPIDEWWFGPKHKRKRKYMGGPLGAPYWWEGRDGPVGIIRPDNHDSGSIFSDEMI